MPGRALSRYDGQNLLSRGDRAAAGRRRSTAAARRIEPTMRITVVGTGYVGMVTGVCLADTGNHVVGLDIDKTKVERLGRGECTIFEPGLTDLLVSNLEARRFRLTTDLREAVEHAEVIFIAIGTPPNAQGAADLS